MQVSKQQRASRSLLLKDGGSHHTLAVSLLLSDERGDLEAKTDLLSADWCPQKVLGLL